MLKIFYSCQKPFSAESNGVREVLYTLGAHLVDGSHQQFHDLNQEIKSSILQCDSIVSVYEKYEDAGYLTQEIEFAKSYGKPIVVVETDKSLPEDFPRPKIIKLISLRRGTSKAIADLIKVINELKASLFIPTEPILAQHSSRSEISEEQWKLSTDEKIKNIKNFLDLQNYEKALEESYKLSIEDPSCWRADMAASTALTYLDRLSDADKKLDEMIQKFSTNPRAVSYGYQNKAWVRNTAIGSPSEEDKQAIINYLQASIKSEPRLIVFLNLIIFLLLHNLQAEAEAKWFNCLEHFSLSEARESFSDHLTIASSALIKTVEQSKLFADILLSKNETKGEKDEN